MEHYFAANYFLALGWGLAVFFGLIGLGRLVALAIGSRDAIRAGWGLQAVWGMAVYLFLGGVLAVGHACTALAISLLVGLGLAALGWTTYRAGWPTKAAVASWPWHIWPAFVLAMGSFAAGVGWQANVNTGDDFCAYYNFCEKLLTSGSFDDPFSWRRLASLGGHTLLQASILTNTSFSNIQMFEVGICPVIFLGLFIGFREGALVRSRLGAFLALVAVTTPILRANTTSHFTGVVLFMGLFVTLDLLERAEARRRWLVLTGLVAAALGTLRAPNVGAATGALVVFWLGWGLRDRPPVRRALLDALWCGGALLAALLPWMIMSERSNQSPLFPLFAGGHNPDFLPQGMQGTVYQKLHYLVEAATDLSLLPLLLCLLAAPAWRKGLASSAVAFSAVVCSALVAYGLSAAPDVSPILRYVQPLLLAGAFATLATAALSRRSQRTVWVLAAVCLAANLGQRSEGILRQYRSLEHAERTIAPYDANIIADYRRAQGLVPAGRRALVCADFPALFDHARNDLWNIDFPHATSPSPGLPYHRPPEETKRYLRQLGVEYIIYLDFENGVGGYKRNVWRAQVLSKTLLFRTQVPYYLDFFDTIEGLAASERVLGRQGLFTVIQFKP